MRRNLAGVYINGLDWDDHHSRCAEFDKDTYDDYKSVIRGITLNIPNDKAGYGFFANIVNKAIAVAVDEIHQEVDIIDEYHPKNILIDRLRTNKNIDNE